MDFTRGIKMDLNPHLIMNEEQAEIFQKILQTLDFSICKDDYDVAKLMFIRMDSAIRVLQKELIDAKKDATREQFPEGFAEEVERIGANRNSRKGSESNKGTERSVRHDPRQGSLFGSEEIESRSNEDDGKDRFTTSFPKKTR